MSTEPLEKVKRQLQAYAERIDREREEHTRAAIRLETGRFRFATEAIAEDVLELLMKRVRVQGDFIYGDSPSGPLPLAEFVDWHMESRPTLIAEPEAMRIEDIKPGMSQEQKNAAWAALKATYNLPPSAKEPASRNGAEVRIEDIKPGMSEATRKAAWAAIRATYTEA
jgi:hypothetical protein